MSASHGWRMPVPSSKKRDTVVRAWLSESAFFRRPVLVFNTNSNPHQQRRYHEYVARLN